MIEISQLPALLRRHLFWLMFAPAVFMGLAFAYLVLKTPMYRASAELLIEQQAPSFVAIRSTDGGTTAALQPIDLNSQSYIIVSATVLDDVSSKLDLDNDPGLNRPGLLQKLLGSSLSGQKTETERRASTIAALRNHLQVNRLSGSYVFQIRASHPDPVIAASIANEVASSYITESRAARSEALARTGTSLGKQAVDLRARLQAAEAAVERYKVQNGLISTEAGGLVVDQQIQALNSQIAAARVKLEQAKAAYQLAEPLTPANVEAGGLPQSAQNSVLNSLKVQYARIAQREAEAATTLGANHPTLKELRSQLTNTSRQINAELQRLKRSLKGTYDQANDTLAALEEKSAGLQSENSAQGRALIELRQLQSEVDASRAVYEAFLTRSKELEEQPELEANGSRVLSEAQVPSAPYGPRKIIVLLAAGMFGFAAAAGSIVGWTILRGLVTSERDLVARTGVPVLTHVRSSASGTSEYIKRLIPGFSRGRASNGIEAEFAMTRIAYTLRQAYADQRPATILVLSIDGVRNTERLSRQIATHLSEMGEDVLFARSNIGANNQNDLPRLRKQPKHPVSPVELLARSAEVAGTGRPGRQVERANTKGSGTLASYLSVERVDVGQEVAVHSSLASAAEDYLIVDCGAAEANPVLPVLLRYCDGILLVSEKGETRLCELDRTLAYLQPWRDRVIGNVVLEAA